MADTKITGLQTPGAFPVVPSTDVLPIVIVADNSMAASGSTRKVTVNQILGAGGTATLASATISGDLTVATNRFAVSASGVGIGTTTMTYNLNVTGAAPTVTGIKLINTSGTSSNLCMFSASSAYSSFGVPNNAGWLAVEGSNPLAIGPTGNGGIVFVNNGSTAMTLNSTGLGVGVASPSYQIHARKDQAAFTTVAIDNQNAIAAGTGTQFLLIDGGVNAGWFRRNRDGSGNTDIGYKDALRFRGQIAGTERTDMTLDTSGNVISNVTGTAPTLATNSQMVFNLTSNTNLRISVRGTDGVTRVANITLA